MLKKWKKLLKLKNHYWDLDLFKLEIGARKDLKKWDKKLLKFIRKLMNGLMLLQKLKMMQLMKWVLYLKKQLKKKRKSKMN